MHSQPSLSWGLGMEHEMLIGVDGDNPGETRVLLSSNIVYSMFTRRLEPVYAAVERAMGRRMKLVRPVTEATVMLAPAKRKPANSTRASAAACKLVARALVGIPVEDMRMFIACMFPSVWEPCGNAAWQYRMPVRHWTFIDALQTDKSLTVAKRRLLVVTTGRSSTMAYRLTPMQLRSLVANLVLDTDAARAYHAAVEVTLDAALSKTERVRRPMIGDTLHVSAIPWDSRGIIMLTRDKHARLANGADLASAVFGTVVMPYPGKDEGRVIEVDGDFVEVKSIRFRNASIEDVMSQVRTHEAAVISVARTIDASAHILPHSGYARIRYTGDTDAGGSPNYAGSFHVWFTLPHAPATTSAADFAGSHVAFASCLQWMEPLLLACSSGDPRALGAGTRFPRANMRGTFNPLSGIGTTDVCGSMPLLHLHTAPLWYHANMDDFVAAVASGDPSKAAHHLDGRQPYRIFYTLDGKTLIPYAGCISIERADWGRDPEQPQYPFVASGIGTRSDAKVTSALASLRAGFNMHTGNDIRVPWCNNFQLKLQHGWTAHAVITDRSKKRFVLHFAHRELKAWTAKAPLRSKQPSNVGFEFRLMYNMPTANMEQLLRVFVLVAAASSNNSKGCSNPVNDNDWAGAVAAVLVMGRFAPMADAYMRKLRMRLGLSVGPRSGKRYDKRAQVWDARTSLLALCTELHDRYASHPWVAAFTKAAYSTPPVPKDANMAGWVDAFAAHARRSPALLAELVKLHAADPLDARGWASSVLRKGVLPTGWLHDLPYMHAALSDPAVHARLFTVQG